MPSSTHRNIGSVAIWSLTLIAWCGAMMGGSAQAPTSIAASRVLVVYNANWGDGDGDGVPDSLQVANYYAVKRGVPAANLLGLGITLNFGPIRYDVSEYTRFYSEMIQPIRNKLEALGPANIDVILLCYGVPYNLGSDTSGTGFVAIDNVLMALNNWSATSNNIQRLNNPYVATKPTFESDRPAFTHDYKISGQDMYLVARLDGMSALRAQNLVDQALYAERYLTAGSGLFNGTVYVDSRYGPYSDAQLTANSAVIAGSYSNYDSADANIAYSEHYVAGTGLPLKWENTAGSLSIGQQGAQYHDGTSAATAPRALMYSGWYNAAEYFDVYEWLPGAVACDLNSVSMVSIREGFGWGAAALARGASAACGVLGEPLLNGHPRPNILLYYLLKGYTFAEASTLATRKVGWMAINIGDPLYAPFRPKTVVADTSLPAIAPGYPRVAAAADPAARIIEVRLDDAVEPETARILVDYGLTAAYGATASPGQGFYRSAAIVVSGLQSGATYHYRVRMIDPVGNTSTSGDFTFSTGGVPPPAPDAPPIVALIQPESGSSVSGSVGLAATASDDIGVVLVQFLVDGVLVASDVSAPYAASWDSTTVTNGAHTIVARAVDTAGNASTSAAIAISVANGGGNPQPQDEIWVGDALPTGAIAAADGGDGWSWIASNPTAYSGALAHQSAVAGGVHQHYFYGAQTTMSVAAGDTLIAYVYLDPASPPSEVMLQWNDGTWNARAYWGANVIPWGVDGTASRRYMGALPAAGQWARLEVPAQLVGLEGATLNGMAFTLWGGRATWDHAGKSTSSGGTRLNFAAAANGGVASASSSYSAGYGLDGANNGDRAGVGWGAGGGWNDASWSAFPDTLRIDFAGPRTIDEIDVFSVQDAYSAPVQPTVAMSFSQYGLVAFDVQYWNGSSWVAVPNGSIAGNNLVWRKITFTAITTTAIRVVVNQAADGFSRITELEAWGTPTSAAAALQALTLRGLSWTDRDDDEAADARGARAIGEGGRDNDGSGEGCGDCVGCGEHVQGGGDATRSSGKEARSSGRVRRGPLVDRLPEEPTTSF